MIEQYENIIDRAALEGHFNMIKLFFFQLLS
jgi:hypothetical protein